MLIYQQYADVPLLTGKDGLHKINNKYIRDIRRVMKFTMVHMIIVGILAIVLGGAGVAGIAYTRLGFRSGGGGREGFRDARACGKCGDSQPCECKAKIKCPPIAPCPRVMEPDLSKYILKSQIPSSGRVQMPEMSSYMLKTECPPVPDLSKYVLKSSIPKPQPIIIDNSSCKKDAGECPPCPRTRCPVVKCPPPTKCPLPAPCPRPVCPPTVVKCKSEESTQGSTVRPFLAPLSMNNFGVA